MGVRVVLALLCYQELRLINEVSGLRRAGYARRAKRCLDGIMVMLHSCEDASYVL